MVSISKGTRKTNKKSKLRIKRDGTEHQAVKTQTERIQYFNFSRVRKRWVRMKPRISEVKIIVVTDLIRPW